MLRDFFKRLFGKKEQETVNSESTVQTVISPVVLEESVVKPTSEMPSIAATKKKRATKPKKIAEQSHITAWPFDEPVTTVPAKITARKAGSESKAVNKSAATEKKRSFKKTVTQSPAPAQKKKATRKKKNA